MELVASPTVEESFDKATFVFVSSEIPRETIKSLILLPSAIRKGTERTVYLKDKYALKYGEKSIHQNKQEVLAYLAYRKQLSSARIVLADILAYTTDYKFVLMERLTQNPNVSSWAYSIIDCGQTGINKEGLEACYDYGNLASLLRSKQYAGIFGFSL